jgi:putative transposase
MPVQRDELSDGKRIWVSTVLETCSRVCPVTRVVRAAAALVVIEAIERAGRSLGLPHKILVNQVCHFKDLDLRAYAKDIALRFSMLGRRTDCAYIKSFKAITRLECPGQQWLLDLHDAIRKIGDKWLRYNEERPHSAIGHRPPVILSQKPRRPTEARIRPEVLT